MPPFEQWLRDSGFDADQMEKPVKDQMRVVYNDMKRRIDEAGNPPAPSAGGQGNAPQRGENLEQFQARTSTILATAEAATATATPAVRAEVLTYANKLLRGAEPAGEVIEKIGEKVRELAGDDGGGQPVPGEQDPGERELSAVPRDLEGTLSKREIISIFGEEREDRAVYRHAGESVVRHYEHGDDMGLRGLFKDLEGRKGLLRIHDEAGGSPTVRVVSAASANVAIQVVLTTLLNKRYDERPPVTDPMITTIPSSANEETLPEVEAENGVRKVEEGQPYPIMGGTDRSVKTSYHKWGAAVAQTRENSIFDKLGRMSVLLTSLSRQLRSERDKFRLARICDYSTYDGRYIARPGDDAGSAAFYSTTADHRGNVNLKETNGLADYTDIDNVVQVLEDMKLLDDTYVMPQLKVLLVDSSKKATAWKIINSLYCPPVGDETANPMQVNPYGPEGMYSNIPMVLSHPLVGTYAGADTTWFAGDPAQQFYEKEVWGVEVAPKMTDGEMALRDIVGLWIGSFCCDVVALSNMFFVKNTA